MFDQPIHPICYRSAAEIAEAIGVDKRRIPKLVRDAELPAWKEDGKWKALPHKLIEWMEKRQAMFSQSQE